MNDSHPNEIPEGRSLFRCGFMEGMRQAFWEGKRLGRLAAEALYAGKVPESNDLPSEDEDPEYHDGPIEEVGDRWVKTTLGRVRVRRDFAPTPVVGDHVRVYGSPFEDEQGQMLPEKKRHSVGPWERCRGVFINGRRVRYAPIPAERREATFLRAREERAEQRLLDAETAALDARVAKLPPVLYKRMWEFRYLVPGFVNLPLETVELAMCEEAVRIHRLALKDPDTESSVEADGESEKETALLPYQRVKAEWLATMLVGDSAPTPPSRNE